MNPMLRQLLRVLALGTLLGVVLFLFYVAIAIVLR
jgi:hypothetical protein